MKPSSFRKLKPVPSAVVVDKIVTILAVVFIQTMTTGNMKYTYSTSSKWSRILAFISVTDMISSHDISRTYENDEVGTNNAQANSVLPSVYLPFNQTESDIQFTTTTHPSEVQFQTTMDLSTLSEVCFPTIFLKCVAFLIGAGKFLQYCPFHPSILATNADERGYIY